MELNQDALKRLRALQMDGLHAGVMSDSHGAFCATCGFPNPCEGALVREGLRRAAAALDNYSTWARGNHSCDECDGSPGPDTATWDVLHEQDCSFGAAEEVLVFSTEPTATPPRWPGSDPQQQGEQQP